MPKQLTLGIYERREVMKDRTFSKWLIIFIGVVAIIGFCFTPAFADDNEILDESFGQFGQCTWIPSRNFTPISSNTSYGSGGHNYRYFTSTTDAILEASFNLPSGAFLGLARLYYYDSNAGNVSMYIFREWAPDNWEVLGSFTTTTDSGWGSDVANIGHTIQNRNNMYTVRVSCSAAINTLGFMGVRLYWARQISPAPSTATFDDVFSSDWYFQGVEALAAAGITQGCNPPSNTLFCPNSAVTRAQMAVFLARALGLHWSYGDGY
jgi:hypothetical protein